MELILLPKMDGELLYLYDKIAIYWGRKILREESRRIL